MSHFAAFSTLLTASAASTLFAQNSPASARDLYLEKLSGDSATARHHLGLRYTELLVDPSTRRVREVDPETVFHEGDCIAVEFTPNRNGALYVLNHGSSGAWQLLIPNPHLPDASGAVQAGVTLRVPTDYCFRLDGKPGTETLVLAITEREQDAGRMHDLVFTGGASPNVVVIRGEVESWQRFAGRDLKLEKIVSPEAAGERPNSVYAVMSSGATAERLVVEIKIHHE